MDSSDGRLIAWWETGTEGVIWSLDNRVRPDRDSLTTINDDDHLTVYDAAGKTLWEGIIDLEYERNYQPFPQNPEYGQQAICNHWVHGFQRTVEPETWAKWFFDGYRARLRPETPLEDHPFDLPANELEQALKDLSEADAITLNRQARFQWIRWYGRRIDDHWETTASDGMFKELGFTEAQALEIMGSPTGIDIQTWAFGGEPPLNMERLYRLALLCGITGRLHLRFGDKFADSSLAGWLSSIAEMTSLEGLIVVHDRLRVMVEQPPYGFITP